MDKDMFRVASCELRVQETNGSRRVKSSYTKYHRSIIASRAYDLVRLYRAHLYFHALKTLLLQNYTRIGLNLVTASAQSHSGAVALNAPFEAYGKPGVPTKIVKVYPLKNVYVLVNNPAGSLLSRVTDTHGNPVSNVPLTFTVQDAVSNNPATDPLPAAYWNMGLYTRETCTNPYPISGDCATQPSLPLKTHYYGAQVETILGNTLNTHYTVRVSAAGLEAVTYDLYSRGTRGSANAYVPSVLMLWNLGIVNEKGEPVNAAKAGTELKAPLTAKMFLLQDEYDIQSEQCATSDGSGQTVTFTGYSLVSKGVFSIRPINNGAVSFTAIEGGGTAASTQSPGNGMYQTTYQTGIEPAKNIVEADGSAEVTIPEIWGKTSCLESPVINERTVTLEHGQYGLFDQTTHELIPEYASTMKPTYTAYGVDTTLTIQPSIVLLNDQGYTTTDTTLTYTIQPPEYNALRTDLDSYKVDQSFTETWEGYVVNDKTQGQGTVVFVAGTQFDISQLYREQVVLNRGTDMEIKGEKKDLPLARISVMKHQSSVEADEIKFGDGSRPEKKYYLVLLSRALLEDCAGLTGKISIVNNNGQTITVSGAQDEYYLAEYPLEFPEALFGGCKVRIKDMTDSGNLDQYIVLSNKSRATLNWPYGFNPALIDTVILYGGIGNTFKLEVNGAKQYLPIEPVGVIVLGIDGVRQDMLYPPEEQQINDPAANYYIEPSQLSGLCEVMGGKSGLLSCDSTGWENRHIKLQNVTAIFPSITLASWASIFTGVQSGKTGILGNEFFARDLIEQVNNTYQWKATVSSAMGTLPPGMVTFSDGAFPMMSILKRYPMFGPDAHVPGRGAADLTLNTIASDGTNVKTVFESIKEINTELKSTVVMHNYNRGADEWRYQESLIDNMRFLFNHYTGDDADISRLMDSSPADDTVGYVNNLSITKKKFPSLLAVYFAGLDHWAHDFGMDAYVQFFKDNSDKGVKKIVTALKSADEFDNKIFVIVADHGMTAMPMDLKYKDTNWLGNEVLKDAEMSCKLKLDFVDPEFPDHITSAQKAERANNNLHIWELGEVFKAIGENGWGQYKVLAPNEIAKLYKKIDKVTNQIVELPYGATVKVEEADVIVGLNGPMAHVYLTDMNKLGKIAELFRLTLDDHPAEAAQWWNVDNLDYSDFKINTMGRLKMSVDKILVRVAGDYCVFDGLNDDGSVRCAATGPLSAPAYVDAWTRINGMNNKDRSGDIILIMRDATSGNAVDRYTTGVACKSWHGSLSPSDSYVPFIVSYPGGNKTDVENILKRDTLCKTDYSSCKSNWKLSDVVKEIISEQYK